MKIILRSCALLFLLVMMQSTFAAKINSESPNFISMSDLHFNPFDGCASSKPCPLIDKLRQAPVNEWESILTYYQRTPSSYSSDVNYPLLKDSLQVVSKKVTDKTRFVLILGDLLGHNFDQYFAQYSSDASTQAYKAFVKKTMQFIANEIDQAFPKQDVFVAIGNNDANTGDNTYDPTQQFYRETAEIWGGLIHTSSAVRTAMEDSFATAGYYAVDVPEQSNLRLIVLNSVILAEKSKGEGIDQAAQKELDWLNNELNTHRKKTLIIMHIPDSIDVYSTVKSKTGELVELWKPQYTQQFLVELQLHPGRVVGILAGHFHMDWFQVLTNAGPNNLEIPVIGVPAISPVFGNNPGFKVFTYSDTLNLSDYETFYNPINTHEGWQSEYDFNAIYQPACACVGDCQIVNGMNLLQRKGGLADHYKQFYSVGTNSQPITKSPESWPYYWCMLHKPLDVNNRAWELGYKYCLVSL